MPTYLEAPNRYSYVGLNEEIRQMKFKSVPLGE